MYIIKNEKLTFLNMETLIIILQVKLKNSELIKNYVIADNS